jgi:phosphoadenosine phosphosulfate reductase
VPNNLIQGKEMPMIEWLEDKQLYKFNPLLHWTYAEVVDY